MILGMTFPVPHTLKLFACVLVLSLATAAVQAQEWAKARL